MKWCWWIHIYEMISVNLHWCNNINDLHWWINIDNLHQRIQMDLHWWIVSIYFDELISRNISWWSTLMNPHHWIYIYESILMNVHINWYWWFTLINQYRWIYSEILLSIYLHQGIFINIYLEESKLMGLLWCICTNESPPINWYG